MSNKEATYKLSAIAWTLIIVELVFWISGAFVWYFAPAFFPGIQYHNPEWGQALMALPVLSLVFILVVAIKNKNIHKLADLNLTAFILPETSSTLSTIRFLSFRFALAFIIIGIIDPKIGSRLEEVETRGADLTIVFDVSRSMLAEDIEPNRLERGKMAASRLIENMHGDRVSLVVYAADAFVQMPLTTDYEAAKFFLSSISTNSVAQQGTSLGNALRLAEQSFDTESAAQKAVIVITDGENHSDNAIQAAEELNSKGIIVHAIGVGSQQGAPIPIKSRGGGSDFLKDKNGDIVVSQLNSTLLQELVEAGDGVMVQSGESYVPLDGIRQAIANMQKAELGTFNFTDYEHRHQVFFGIALLFLLVQILLPERKPNWKKRNQS